VRQGAFFCEKLAEWATRFVTISPRPENHETVKKAPMKPSHLRRVICILALTPILTSAQELREPEELRQPDPAQPAPAKPAPKPELALPGAVSTNPLSFVAIAPCRLVDTRSTTVPAFPVGFGWPSLLPSLPRNVPLPGSCGLPTNPPPQAYSLNVTVVPIAGASPSGGFIVVYPGIAGPAPGPLPFFASLVWQGSTVYLSNAVIVASNPTDGSIYLDSNVRTDIVIDINGYFAAPTDSNAGANTALGYQSLQANTGGTGNTANGYQALETNSVGVANTASGSNRSRLIPAERAIPPVDFSHSRPTPPDRTIRRSDSKPSRATSWV
jgi:hypothetical protein